MSEDERIMELLIKSDINLTTIGLTDIVAAFKLGSLHGWWLLQEDDSDNKHSGEES